MTSHPLPLLIVNAKAKDNQPLQAALEASRAAGRAVEVRVTENPGDAQRFAGEAAEGGVKTVIAGGGDGTINEVLRGILAASAEENRPSLGVIPLGTANDFARAAAIPLDPVEALNLIFESEPRPIDCGSVGGQAFVNMATGGFGANVTKETPEGLKQALGKAAYLLTGLTKFSSLAASEVRLCGPDFEWEGKFFVLAVGNSRQAGGGYLLCPDAVLDDGLLDIVILPELQGFDFAGAVLRMVTEGVGGLEPRFVRHRLRWIEIRSPETMQINLDGEPIEGTSFRFEVMPKAIRLHLPAKAPVLS